MLFCRLSPSFIAYRALYLFIMLYICSNPGPHLDTLPLLLNDLFLLL